MTRYNSSHYRVCPLAEIIKCNQSNFEKMIYTVSELPKTIKLLCPMDLGKYFYGDNEKKLKPPKEHLIKLINHIASTGRKEDANSAERKSLYGQNGTAKMLEAKYQAIKSVDSVYNLDDLPKEWFIFEGNTCPDLFIEGEDYVLLCEGKWTEAHITTETTHLKTRRGEYRNQMVRHIQGALNYTDKKIIAFYIVDENCGYIEDLTKAAFDAQIKMETIELSNGDAAKISSSYYGYTTWQDLIRNNRLPGLKFKSKKEIDMELLADKQKTE